MSEPAAGESAWVSAHAFYQDDLDPLVVNVVGPLMAELARDRLAREFFFLRYWDGGNHLRLRVRPEQDTRRGEVERLITDRFGDYLARNPAADSVSPEQYARLARSLAQRENVASYAELPYPNNSLSFIPYRREHDRYGPGAAIGAVERHFAESSRIALRVVTLGASPDQRAAAATALILLTWFVASPDQGHLAAWAAHRGTDVPDLGGPGRESPEDAGGQQRDQVIGLARQMRVLAGGAAGWPAAGTLVDWARSVTTLRDALAARVAAGDLTAPSAGWGEPRGITAAGPYGGVLTVLDTCAHLICNRLGVSVIAEGAIRRLAAHAVGALVSEGS